VQARSAGAEQNGWNARSPEHGGIRPERHSGRRCLDADPEFVASSRLTFSRPPYEVPPGHDLPTSLRAAAAALAIDAELRGMSFWTDAAVLGSANIPSVLFGPGGAGLHSTEEYVRIADVLACRDALASLAINWP
jgi:acetylornithine deacetylase